MAVNQFKQELNDDISALLGYNKDAEPEEKLEISKLEEQTDNNLENKIISETDELINASKSAVYAVLDEVQAAPNDAELISSAASFLRAQTAAIEAISKLHMNKEKLNTQLKITQLKVVADQQMNAENNQTRMLLTREEIMSRLFKDAENNKIIDS